MKTRLFFILFISFSTTLFFTTNTAAQPVAVDDYSLLAAKADTLLNDAIHFKEHVGLTAGIFVDGQIAWTGGAGYRDLKKQTPANSDMVNRLASISKSMTAIAIMQLVEKGKLDLEASVQTYVPDFPKKPEGEITIRQLLTHTSGIPHYKGLLDGFSWKEYKNLSHAVKRFQKRDLKGTPGKVYQYTTYGYVLLGRVIEKASGMSYEAYMKKYIWDVAGMQHTSAEPTNKKVDNKSRLYKKNKKGQLKKDINTNLSMKVPGGGIQSTAADLLKFGQAIIENKLISKETLEKMFYDPKIKNWGNPNIMGFFYYNTEEGNRIIGHNGSQPGSNTLMLILLDKEIVISCLSNTRKGGNVFSLARQLIEQTVSKEVRAQPIKRAITATPSQLDRFTGAYKFGNGTILTISRDGQSLYSQAKDYPPFRLYVENDSTLFYRDLNAWFEFEFDENKIVNVTYVENGKPSNPTKVK